MKFFKRKKDIELLAYTSGEIIPLSAVKDEMFSAGLMGPGIAINSKDGKFYCPVDGKITMLFPTKHALGLKTESGLELLIHIGIDTVGLKGEGFKAYVEDGQSVSKGDLLLEANLELIKSKGYPTEAILCICEPKGIEIEFTLKKSVKVNVNVLTTIRM